MILFSIKGYFYFKGSILEVYYLLSTNEQSIELFHLIPPSLFLDISGDYLFFENCKKREYQEETCRKGVNALYSITDDTLVFLVWNSQVVSELSLSRQTCVFCCVSPCFTLIGGRQFCFPFNSKLQLHPPPSQALNIGISRDSSLMWEWYLSFEINLRTMRGLKSSVRCWWQVDSRDI